KIITSRDSKKTYNEKLLIETQLKCLIAGLDNNPNIITPQVTWMFWGIRKFYVDSNGMRLKSDDFDDSWKMHPEAVKILRGKMQEKDLKHFLKSLISKDMYNDGKYGFHEKLIQDVFETIFWLRETVRSNEHTDKEVKGE